LHDPEPGHVPTSSNAIKWANCSREELNKLGDFPKAVIHIHARRRRLELGGHASADRSSSDDDGEYGDVEGDLSDVAESYGGGGGNGTVGRRLLAETAAEAQRGAAPLKLKQPNLTQLKQQQQQQKQSQRTRERRALRHSESSFADHMRSAALCPLMCGDTPTSRRT